MDYHNLDHRRLFAAGLTALGVTFNREVSRPMLSVYFDALRDLPLADVQSAIIRIRDGWTPQPNEMFPVPSTIRRHAQPYVDAAAEAGRLFDRIEAETDRRTSATAWGIVRIGSELGWAAAEAFAACGGSSAFGTLTDRDRPFTRRAFADAYQRAHQAAAKGLAPPVREPPLLPSDDARLKRLTAGIGDGPRGTA